MKQRSILFVASEADVNLPHLRHCANARRIAHQTLCLTTSRNQPCASTIIDGHGEHLLHDTLGEPIDFKRIHGVWARGWGRDMARPPPVGSFGNLAHHEWVYYASYVLDGLRHCHWVNDIAASRRNANRLTQKPLAQRFGFRVPDSLVTNVPAQAKAFLARHGRVIIKHISPGSPDSHADRALAVSLLDRGDEDLLDQVRFCPTLLQEVIDKAAEFRVTIIGDRVFCAGLESTRNEATAVDSRLWADTELTYYRAELDAGVAQRLAHMLKTVGLVYGAVDLILTPRNEWVFLEINPSGRWGFAEMSTGHAITEALIDELSGAGHA